MARIYESMSVEEAQRIEKMDADLAVNVNNKE